LIPKPELQHAQRLRFHFADPNGNEYAVWSDIAGVAKTIYSLRQVLQFGDRIPNAILAGEGREEMNDHEKINYVEFPAKDIATAKTFFSQVFGWSFEDFGPDYAAFSNEGLNGGFFKSDLVASSVKGGALIVFYSKELENTQSKIEQAGGAIVRAIFSFPGGRRFHFADPNGNEYAVWSDIAAA